MRGSRVDSRVCFASGEVQNLAGFVPSRMAERAAKTPGGACAEKVHSVLGRIRANSDVRGGMLGMRASCPTTSLA